MSPRLKLEEVDAVDADLIEHYRYIVSEGQPDAAERLIDAYERMADQLREMPEVGRKVEDGPAGFASVRCRGLASPFSKYQMYYAVMPGVLRVLAVIHGSTGYRYRTRVLQSRLGRDDP